MGSCERKKAKGPRRGNLRRFFGFLRGHLGKLAALAATVLCVRLLAIPVPLVYRQIVDEALTDKDAGRLIWSIAFLSALLFGGRLLGFAMQALGAKFQHSVLHDVRMTVYTHLQTLDIGFFRRHPTGGLLSRVLSDVARVQSIISREMFELVSSVLQLVIVAGILLWLNPKLSVVSAAVFPILVVLVSLFQTKLYNISRSLQERTEALSARIQENLAATRLIQTMGLEQNRRGKTASDSAGLRDTAARAEAVAAGANLLAIGMTDIPLTLFVWGYGGFLVIDGQLSLGSLIAFHQYLMMLYNPVIQIFRFNIQLQMARAAVDRLYEILDTEPAVRDSETAETLKVEGGRVAFRDVSLGYDDGADIVRDFSLEIAPGEVIGVVGPSGAGKTTIVNALLRFIEPRRGHIEIDGQDIGKVRLESLRGSIGVVAQDVFLFSDSVKENIALGKVGAADAEIEEAARKAYAHEFITELDKGYETALGERGAGLSGGQQQRVSLARVILQNPPIFIFDEATSALDPRSEAAVQKALAQVVEGRTTIIIAHRFSTLKLCHRIAVISGGRLVEVGTHEELETKDGLYKALLEAQRVEGAGAV